MTCLLDTVDNELSPAIEFNLICTVGASYIIVSITSNV